MTLWLSRPCHLVPEAVAKTRRVEGDGLVDSVYTAYGRIHKAELFPVHVPVMLDTIERVAGPLATAACDYAGGADMVRTLFDCRSGTHLSGPAPSYLLAEQCGLVRASPIALAGRGGAEVSAALFLMTLVGAVELPAVVCASQRVSEPDSRSPLSGGALADAVAAVAVGASAHSVNAVFRVIAVSIGSEPASSSSTLAIMALQKAGLGLIDLRWFIRAPIDTPVEILTTAGVRDIGRSSWIHDDFGSADLLVSLSIAFDAGTLPEGPGALVHRGWFGALGVIILEVVA